MLNKRINFSIIAISLLLILSPLLARANEEQKALQLGCVAYAKEASAKAYRQVGQYLEDKLGCQVVVTVYPSYQEVIVDIANEKLDLAILSPLVHVCASEACELTVLGHGVYGVSGDFAYRSTIFVRADSSINSLEDLEDKSIAFVDQLSASGFIVPKVALMKESIIEIEEVFAGNHVDAFRSLLNEDVEACATLNTIMEDEPTLGDHAADVKVLWTSEFVIPSDAFVATSKLSADLQQEITTLLLQYGEAQKQGRSEINAIFSGFVPEDEKLYDGLQKLVNEFSN